MPGSATVGVDCCFVDGVSGRSKVMADTEQTIPGRLPPDSRVVSEC